MIAGIYGSLGNKDKAFEWLEKSFEEHDAVNIASNDSLSNESIKSPSSERKLEEITMEKKRILEKAQRYVNEGLERARKKEFEVALDNFQKAFLLFEELGDSLNAAFQKGNMGSVYRDMGEHTQSLDEYRKALPLFEEIGHKEGVADQFTNIAYIHVMMGQSKEALKYYRKALPLYAETESKEKYEHTKKNIEVLE